MYYIQYKLINMIYKNMHKLLQIMHNYINTLSIVCIKYYTLHFF